MNSVRRELPNFVRVERGRRVAMTHPDFQRDISLALLDGTGASRAAAAGRGQLLSVGTFHGEVFIREYLRGGLVAWIVRDAYFFRNRPLHELRVHQHAWRAGVPTVLPVGAVWERAGLVFRGAYATLRADATDLLAYLQAHPNPAPEILAACGLAIRAMHEAGVYHADLQVKNILVGEGEAFIIDFDGARVLRALTPSQTTRNLARLKQSFIKRGLNLSSFDAVTRSYAATSK